MTLKSVNTTVNKDQKSCFDMLSQPENYEILMPESNTKFELNDRGGFVFQLKGMPEISLKIEDKNPNDTVIWGAAGGKIDFTLLVKIDTVETSKSEIQFHFEGKLSSMMAMMVKKPLKKFIDTLSENLTKI